MGDHNRGRRLPVEILTPGEVRALLQATSRGASGARNRALIALLWRGGLRVGEALGLRPSDLEPARALVRVRAGVAKGGKARAVGLDPEAFAVVDAWLARRRALGLGGRGPLLCTLRGGPLDPGYVRALFKRLARRASIRRRVHPHALRHTHAVELVREGAPLPEVQAQLGHSNLSVTSRYLNHVTEGDLAERARRRPRWAA